ncbi:mucoidy inhibitor MuiA family protein [Myxococcaceae bacterium JPH2]|nr:mucoidy inhibitor MuiA family protein [Myxococcaceae bacterium JPH2]
MHVLPLTLWALVAPAQVSSVVVYPDRAQVTRVKNVECASDTTVHFEDLPLSAEPDSLRARTTAGTAEGLTYSEAPNPEALHTELTKAQARRDALAAQVATWEDASARAKDLDRLAQGFSRVAVTRAVQELDSFKADTRGWGALFDQVLATRMKAIEEGRKAEEQLQDVQRQLTEVATEVTRLEKERSRPVRSAEVRLSCPRGTKAQVELSYLVRDASWTPAYEARAHEAAGVVELTTLANVQQSTGEDWAKVNLVLSTARPRTQATPPTLMPLKVSATQRPQEKVYLVRGDEFRAAASVGQDVTQLGASGLDAAAQGLSVQLTVPESAQVPGNGDAVRLSVSKARLKSTFSLRAVPKLQPVFFRVAQLTNTAPLPFLPGRVDLYRDSGFIGRQALEHVPQGTSFLLTFGVDESVRISRRVVEEMKRDEGFLSSRRSFRYGYRFELTNLGTQSEQVELSDHLPVSELSDVKVEVDEKTTPGYRLGQDDGIATWTVKLGPGEKRDMHFAFRVTTPSSYDTSGM